VLFGVELQRHFLEKKRKTKKKKEEKEKISRWAVAAALVFLEECEKKERR